MQSLRYRAARAHEQAGEFVEAERILTAIIDQDRDHAPALRARARITAEKAAPAACRAAAGDLVAAAGSASVPAEKAVLLTRAAELLQRAGDLADARARLDAALAACPAYLPAMYARTCLLEHVASASNDPTPIAAAVDALVQLAEALLQDLAGAQLGLGLLLGAEAGVVGGGDLQLEQLEQLGPGVVGDQVAAGVLERGDVAGEQLERLAHRREALGDAVEADHRQLAEAIEQLGLDRRVLAADRLELAGAGLDGDVVARRGHAQVLEVAPQADVAGLGLGGGVQQADRGPALAELAEHQAGAGQGHGAQLGRAGVGLELERAQHQLRVAGGLGEAKQVLQQAEVAALLLDGAVRCWGANTSGQLGDGTTTDARGPVSVMF